MFTTIVIVLLLGWCIFLTVGISKLTERIEILHKETNNRISVTDQQTHLRINQEIEELIDIIKTNAGNSDRLREEGLNELEKKIKSLIPPTNDSY